jgi:hypothetical protein
MPGARLSQPGEEVWRLREPGTDRVQSCELRNDSKAGAGWDVMLLEGNELLYSKRCATEADARYAAQVMKDSTRNAGWVEAERKSIEKGGN